MKMRNFLIFKLGRLIPDKVFLQIKYFRVFKKFINFKNPKTYNEKIQWLKIFNRDSYYHKLVDKYESKKIISDLIGDEYVIPTIGGPWNSFDEIDFNKLPDRFVLKTNHDCGGVVICKDKKKFNFIVARMLLEEHLKRDYYLTSREWPYKDIKPIIFAEKFMSNNDKLSKTELTDYKFFCFDGIPKFMFIATDRNSTNETKFDFYDMDFCKINVENGHPNSKKKLEKPLKFELMKKLARKISNNLIHVRVDFYEINGEVYVGEITFFHYSGLVPFQPTLYDNIFGEYINLKDRCEK